MPFSEASRGIFGGDIVGKIEKGSKAYGVSSYYAYRVMKIGIDQKLVESIESRT